MRAKEYAGGGQHGQRIYGRFVYGGLSSEARALFDRANDALQVGYDLTQICFEGPEAELNEPKLKTRSREFSSQLGRPRASQVTEARALSTAPTTHSQIGAAKPRTRSRELSVSWVANPVSSL